MTTHVLGLSRNHPAVLIHDLASLGVPELTDSGSDSIQNMRGDEGRTHSVVFILGLLKLLIRLIAGLLGLGDLEQSLDELKNQSQRRPRRQATSAPMDEHCVPDPPSPARGSVKDNDAISGLTRGHSSKVEPAREAHSQCLKARLHAAEKRLFEL
jgi:hypothetical protein